MSPSSRPTLVAFHAHPDDEAIFTGGLLVRAARAGWRTVVVLATSGEAGITPGVDVADVGALRRREAEAACTALGVDRLVVLPFRDSGLAPRRQAGRGLAGADPHAVLAQFDAALDGEAPSVVTTYDADGVYGHPDHIAVHRAGRLLAAEGIAVYEATIDRAHLHRVRDGLVGRRALAPWRWPQDLTNRLGRLDPGDTTLRLALDPEEELPAKVAAVAEHASQVTFAAEFMGLPPGAFHRLFADEWFHPAGRRDDGFEALVAGRRPPALAGVLRAAG